MFCGVCGNQLQPEAAFCARCGSPRPVTAAPSQQQGSWQPSQGYASQPGHPAPSQSQPVQPEPVRSHPVLGQAVPPQPAVQPTPPGTATASARPRALLAGLIGAGAMALLAGLVALALVLSGTVSLGAQRRNESAGYASAEAAVTAYLEAMKTGDVTAMTRVFAQETWVQHVDLKAFIERLNAYQFHGRVRFPNGTQNDQLNLLLRAADVGSTISYQYVTLSGPDFDVSTPQMVTDGDVDGLYARLQAAFDGTAFTGVSSWQVVTLDRYDAQLAELFASAANQKVIEANLRFQGADELAYPIVELETDAGTFTMFPEVIRYGDRWWLNSMDGNTAALAGLAATSGGLLKS